MDNMLAWAQCVVIIVSEKFQPLVEKKDVSVCPDAVKSDAKSFQKVLKSFIEKKMKTIPSKISLVALKDGYTLPKMLQGMPVVENKDDFVTKVICDIEGKALWGL